MPEDFVSINQTKFKLQDGKSDKQSALSNKI